MKKLISFCISLMLLSVIFASCIEKEENIGWPDSIGSKEITAMDLSKILQKQLGNMTLIIILDRHYRLVNATKLKEALKADKTNEKKYIADIWDCDDYAFTLWRNMTEQYDGIALGVVILAFRNCTHAANLFIDENSQLHYLEPQNDMIDPPYKGIPMIVIL